MTSRRRLLSAHVHVLCPYSTATGENLKTHCGLRSPTLRLSEKETEVTCRNCRYSRGWELSAEEKLLRAIGEAQEAEKKITTALARPPTDLFREREAGRRACKCGWRYPLELSIMLDGSDALRKKVAGEPLTLFVGFRCPECAEPFRLTLATDAILAKRQLPRVSGGDEN
jgi:hypothetical protein